MDEWDEIDLAGSAHITFSGKDRGEIAFLAKPISTCATAGAMAPPAPSSPGKASMTVPPARGRGWAALGGAGRLVGHIFIHRGDRSGFVAEHE